jgi:DNA-binding NtrC family response regulator
VAEGRFREDLYARVAGVRVSTPPLDERREDVMLLYRHFARPVVGERGATADFVEALLLHPWRRNVRELQKLAERLCVLHGAAERWEVTMLDDEFARRVLVRGRETGDTAPVRIAGPPSREELLDLLARFQGNVTEIARYTGRNRKQVYRWMDQHGIARNTGR